MESATVTESDEKWEHPSLVAATPRRIKVETTLNGEEREQLKRRSRGHQIPRSLAEPAQIVLLPHGGRAMLPSEKVAVLLGARK